MGPGGGACVSARVGVYIGTLSPYPDSIGCETASCPARPMQLVQVFTGIPFLEDNIHDKASSRVQQCIKEPTAAAPARHV